MVSGVSTLPGGGTAELLARARERWGYMPPRLADASPRLVPGVEVLEDLSPRADGLEGVTAADRALPVVRQLLEAWPEGVAALQLVDHYTPLRTRGPAGPGCASGHRDPGSSSAEHPAGGRMGVFVTVNDATGCAGGIMHEVAHLRLKCLGIDIEQDDGRLFANGPEAKWFSPIRRDCPRPFSALLHGVYAYCFVLEVDLRAPDPEPYLAADVPRVRRGLVEVARAAEPTEEGEAFLGGVLYWGERLVTAGATWLKERGLQEQVWPRREWK